MATLKLHVQHIDSVSPSSRGFGGIKLSCDMEYIDMEDAVAQFREQLTEEKWAEIVKNTD